MDTVSHIGKGISALDNFSHCERLLSSLSTSVLATHVPPSPSTKPLNEYRIPSDPEAQEYIAAVQAAGVPIGIWLNSPIDGTGYAAVTQENILQLRNAIAGLTQFSDSYAATLCEKLFREASEDCS